MTPDKNTRRYGVIMCGGIGSRFWPGSRQKMPKQFIDLFGTGRSLLQMTFDRLTHILPAENIVVMTNALYNDLVRQQLPDILPDNILLEPARRNTAPCIAWAANHILSRDPEAVMIVAPSDHLITREHTFVECIERAFAFVEQRDALLTLGIRPTRPETGYGYIQVGAPAADGISKVKTFTEKPNKELARVFLDSGEFFWNSGIFLWRADAIAAAIRRHVPDLDMVLQAPADTYADHAAETAFIARTFPACQAVSIDYAVMEKADNVYVETVDFGWSDLGTWCSLWDTSPRNRDGNVTAGCRVMAYESHDNMFSVSDPEKLVVVNSLSDYIVADTGDVLLIWPKEREQEIRQVVNDIKLNRYDRYL